MFMHARSVVSAGIRLNIVGPYEGQECLARSQIHVQKELINSSRMVDEMSEIQKDFAGHKPMVALDQCINRNPFLDLLQNHHERLYSRLFSG